MRRFALAVICVVICLIPFSQAQQCGGTERWAVKDGTDSTASHVDLSHIQHTTIQHLINDIDEPKLPHNNTTRVIPDETQVVSFTAHLVQWKHELDDDDYHLVLTDDSLRFTPHDGQPTGTSLIGEIPDPKCLSGKNGTFGHSSPLLNVSGSATPLGIRIARKELEAEFPDADMSGKFNDAGGVLVDVVGVIFFDRPHGQVGRSPHNLEIHPILSIKFHQHPQELMAATHGLKENVAAAGQAGGGPGPGNVQNVVIQDGASATTATVTTGHALKVDASGSTVTCSVPPPSGVRGRLSPGQSSPDLGYPKVLSICTDSAERGIQFSIDGSQWQTMMTLPSFNAPDGCISVPPFRFVRISGNGFYQASY